MRLLAISGLSGHSFIVNVAHKTLKALKKCRFYMLSHHEVVDDVEHCPKEKSCDTELPAEQEGGDDCGKVRDDRGVDCFSR